MSWISVDIEKPKVGEWVLIRVSCFDYHNVEQGMYRGDDRWVNCWYSTRHNDLYPVTHWQPLPDPPKN